MSIKNELQYKITMERIEYFKVALRRVEKTPSTRLKIIQTEAMNSVLGDLEEKVKVYEEKSNE